MEVLHGPGSALYGDTALGGVVHVFTRAAAGEPGATLSFSAARFQSTALDGAWRRRIGSGHLGVSAGGSRSDGHRAHSRLREGGLNAVLVQQAGDVAFTLSGSGSLRDRDEPGALAAEVAARDPRGSDALFRFDGEGSQRLRSALRAHRSGRLTWSALLAGAARRSDVMRTLLLAAGLGDRVNRELDTRSLDADARFARRFELRGREAQLVLGAALAADSLGTSYRAVDATGAPGARLADEDGERRRAAVYVTQDLRLAETARVLAGLRWDRIADTAASSATSNSHEASSPRLGLNWRIAKSLALFAQGAGAFKAATSIRSSIRDPSQTFRAGASPSRTPASRPSAPAPSRRDWRASNARSGASSRAT